MNRKHVEKWSNVENIFLESGLSTMKYNKEVRKEISLVRIRKVKK